MKRKAGANNDAQEEVSLRKKPKRPPLSLKGIEDGAVAEDVYFEQAYMICAANGTFYDISVVGMRMICIWGKLGSPGTKLEMSMCSEYACSTQLDEKVKEKLRKGYIFAAIPAPVAVPVPDYEVKLIYRDMPQNSYYDKHYTISHFGKDVTIRDGMKGERATTTYKTLKTEAAARKLVDKLVVERIAKGYVHM